MKSVECSLLAGEFRGLEGRTRVGQEGTVGKGDAEGGAHDTEMLHHPVDIIHPEQFGQGPALGRRFRMDLHALPLDLEVELLFQPFDDALADIAERSDIVGKDLNADAHGLYLLFIMLIEHGYDTGCR